jgi:ubiquitin C-terminal hydrolase
MAVDPFFGGQTENCVTCSVCGDVSRRAEAFTQLSLAVPSGSAAVELGALVHEYMADEKMEGSERYMCATCKTKQAGPRARFGTCGLRLTS